MSSFDLRGKLAVMTGARRGIGRRSRSPSPARAEIVGVSRDLEPDGSQVQRDVEATRTGG